MYHTYLDKTSVVLSSVHLYLDTCMVVFFRKKGAVSKELPKISKVGDKFCFHGVKAIDEAGIQ